MGFAPGLNSGLMPQAISPGVRQPPRRFGTGEATVPVCGSKRPALRRHFLRVTAVPGLMYLFEGN